ncbi:hypothetical protein [Methanobacterium spitsbergense]|uniref:Uncharacterized protein n=1 Tax=Methanobacterium spitsbergense TaxID=2874285 RepID=A0A8T5V054_9EURY|nr:hypothetical protein [Methanobacterium spitsbergense]MBZ2166369.1 hypothetical protein [Methanobacterium spitsbergense]
MLYKFDFATRILLEGHARKFGVKEEDIPSFIDVLEQDILIPKDKRQSEHHECKCKEGFGVKKSTC